MAVGSAIQDTAEPSTNGLCIAALCRCHLVQPCVSCASSICGPVGVEATRRPARPGSVPIGADRRGDRQPPAF